MRLDRLAVTGARWTRYEHLYEALRDRVHSVDVLETGALRRWDRWLATALAVHPDKEVWCERRFKTAFAFSRRSSIAQAAVLELARKPDLVLHIHSVFCPSAGSLTIPFMFYLDYTMALAEEQFPPWAPFLFGLERDAWFRRERRAYQQAAHIFTMSAMVKRSLADSYGIPEDKVTVVGAAGDFRRPCDGARTRSGQTLLFVSAEFRRKGGDVLFRAFEELRRSKPGLTLLLAGDRPPVPLPEGARYVGFVKDREVMRELYLQADLAVLPSRCDPFPLSLIEAMNYGLPCVATRVGAISEIVADGISGLLVRSGDARELAEACRRILDDDRLWRRMSDAGRDKVRSVLNWDTVAAKMVGVMAGEEKLEWVAGPLQVGS